LRKREAESGRGTICVEILTRNPRKERGRGRTIYGGEKGND